MHNQKCALLNNRCSITIYFKELKMKVLCILKDTQRDSVKTGGGGGDHDALFPSADPLWSKHEILFSLSTNWNGPEHCNKSTLGVEIIKVFSRCNRGSLVMSLPPKHTHNPTEVSATLAQ